MIDFKYTVVDVLILIGFAMLTCGLLVLVTFTFKYAQMANNLKQIVWFNYNTTTQNGSYHLIAFI